MRGYFIGLALCALVLAVQGAEENNVGGASCNLDIRMDFSSTSPPLVLVEDESGDWKLAEPTSRSESKSFMDLSNKKVKLACPGNGNTLTQTGTATAEATCSAESGSAAFIVNGESIAVGDVTCSEKITPYEQATGKTCKGDGTEFTIGFIVEETMHGLITSCQRVEDGKTYYSQHVLHGEHLPERGNGGRKGANPRFAYYNSILFNGFSPALAYYQTNQLKRLASAMGQDAYSIFSPFSDKFFIAGHFCPDTDFILDTWRFATFTYVNAQPQWQQLNGAGNWKNVETYVRYHAVGVNNTLNVITGAVGTLTPTTNGVYLADQNRIPVPNNYVKLVQDPRTNECIGFVGNNFDNSYASAAKCSISCEDYSWPTFTKTNTKGTISCCTAAEIKASYSEALPDTVFDCSGGVLKYQG